MKTITFEELIELGVKSVTVVIDGYQTKGIFSHWEPFNRDRKVEFNLNFYKGLYYILENDTFVVENQESETYSVDEKGKVFLYNPEFVYEA